eukprot:2935479-Alexandrium_andersonii.AAC.1
MSMCLCAWRGAGGARGGARVRGCAPWAGACACPCLRCMAAALPRNIPPLQPYAVPCRHATSDPSPTESG